MDWLDSSCLAFPAPPSPVQLGFPTHLPRSSEVQPGIIMQQPADEGMSLGHWAPAEAVKVVARMWHPNFRGWKGEHIWNRQGQIEMVTEDSSYWLVGWMYPHCPGFVLIESDWLVFPNLRFRISTTFLDRFKKLYIEFKMSQVLHVSQLYVYTVCIYVHVLMHAPNMAINNTAFSSMIFSWTLHLYSIFWLAMFD